MELRLDTDGASRSMTMSADQDAAGGKPTALVVDDSRTGRRIVTTLLTILGFAVAEASSVASAITTIETKTFDLITVDRNLDKEDGVDLVKSMRAHPNCGEAPRIVALTGHVGEAHSNAFFEAGADAFLAKPFTAKELAEILDALGFNHLGKDAVQG